MRMNRGMVKSKNQNRLFVQIVLITQERAFNGYIAKLAFTVWLPFKTN